MKNLKNTYSCLMLFLLVFCFLQACTKDVVDVKEYITYIEDEDNGLRQSESANGVKLEVQYKPCEYVALKETKEHISSPGKLSELKEILDGYYYFTLRIASEDGKGSFIEDPAGAGSFYSALTYCMTRMQNDLMLVAGQDTLKCEMFHFERNYNLASYNDFILGFRAVQGLDQYKDLILLFQDQVFDGRTWRFVFKGDDIKDVPQVNV